MSRPHFIPLTGIFILAAFSPCKAGDATVYKTDSPQTNAQIVADGHCPLPWSPDSKNVQYMNYTGVDGHIVQIVRFEGPLASLRRFASRWFINRLGQPGTPARRGTPAPAAAFDATLAASLAKQAASGVAADARVTWFDTDKISHGEIHGAPGPGNPVFLIDTDRSVLYFWCAN